ncbi:toll-like receptor 4 [Mytilus californianus]|uniref:toll-like receptor 4 n=1 Tax=Mytilus californianus TaxID=6549 RepID=UPI0022473C41|nr:toll-like receptor 4 [Mytilus californianus]
MLIFAPVILVFISTSVIESRRCAFDTRCYCSSLPGSSLYKVDCSNRTIRYIPVFPKNVTSIDLSFNMINRIPDFHFAVNAILRNISFSHNLLNRLDSHTFSGPSELISIKVDNNNISMVSAETFRFLPKLRHLDLKNNKFKFKNLNLTYLSNLTSLRIDFLNAFQLPAELASLKSLDISGESGRCEIKLLTPDTFKYLSGLNALKLSACKINNIYKGTFSNMKNLFALDLSFNTCLKFSGFVNVTYDLPHTSIKILKINKIHKTFEMNTKLMKSHVRYLRYTNITELHVDSNRIQQVEKGVISMLPHTIRNLYMSDNVFSYGSYLTEIFIMPVHFANISFLFNTHNPEKEEICKHHDEEPSVNQRQQHDEGFNMFEIRPFHRLGKGQTNFTFSKLNSDSKLETFQSRDHPKFFPVPRLLKTLIYRQCQLRYEIPSLRFSDNTLEYLDGSSNIFYSWKGPLLNLNHVRFLNLSNNLCSYVSKVFFYSTPNLQIMHVDNNLLGFVLPDDVNGEILQNLHKLEEINLAYNRIPSLPYKFFKSQALLKKISLSGNMLDEISFKISHMIHLRHLDLSYNRLSSISKDVRDHLDKTVRPNMKLELDLTGNPFKCTCETIGFVKWMFQTAIKLHNQRKYQCKLSNGEKIFIQNPSRLYEKLKKECSTFTSLIIGTTVVMLLLLAIISWAIIYRYRWKLRYMYYMVKNRYHGQQPITSTENERIYTYDAFISYADNDRFFVHEKFLNKLEDESGLKLCLHKRDFLPGNDIAANITNAIHESRKVVVIMSQHFLKSYWCMFEYNMARIESIYSRNKENILFLVFLEELSSKDLPLIVLELVQSQSYIEYPHDEYGNEVFWTKLTEVLS